MSDVKNQARRGFLRALLPQSVGSPFAQKLLERYEIISYTEPTNIFRYILNTILQGE